MNTGNTPIVLGISRASFVFLMAKTNNPEATKLVRLAYGDGWMVEGLG